MLEKPSVDEIMRVLKESIILIKPVTPSPPDNPEWALILEGKDGEIVLRFTGAGLTHIGCIDTATLVTPEEFYGTHNHIKCRLMLKPVGAGD